MKLGELSPTALRERLAANRLVLRTGPFALLQWGMNWCIAGHARHYLVLHAAVLERDGGAVVLPGDSGAGKSTLTAALMLAGRRLLLSHLLHQTLRRNPEQAEQPLVAFLYSAPGAKCHPFDLTRLCLFGTLIA